MVEDGNNKGRRHDATVPLTPPGARSPGGPGGDPLLGKIVDGRFKLRLVLGEGGMGKVYLAEDQKLTGRRVALKLMGPSLTMDPEFRSRFEREAVLQANLPHPQIIQILDMGETPEGAFIVMEYSDGRSLGRILRELGPLPLERAIEIIEQVLEVLDFAHGQHVVHRDLKPANILIEERPGREVVRLLDFGIAKLISRDGGSDGPVTLTRQGFAYGTLGYMAPEQARGELELVDHRVDIYAVGIMLHEMLTGSVPAPPESRTHPVRYAMWVAENKIKPLAETHPELGVAEQVDAILQKALRRDPAKRFQSALAFRNAIREFRQGASARTVAGAIPDTVRTQAERSVRRDGTARSGGTRSARSPLPWAIAGVLGLASVGLGFLWLQAKGTASDQEASLGSIRRSFAGLGASTDDLDAGVKALEEEVKALRESNDLEARNRDKKEIESLQKDLSSVRVERDNEVQRAKTAREELSVLQQEKAAADAELAGLRKLTRVDPAELQSAKERADNLEKRADGLQNQLDEANKQMASLEREKARLEGLIGNPGGATAALAEAQGKLRELEKSAGELRTELAAVKLERDGLTRRQTELESDVQAARNRAEQNGETLKMANGELARVRKERDDLDQRIRQREQEVTRLQGDVSRLQLENGTLRNNSAGGMTQAQSQEFARLQQRERDLTSSLQQAQRDLDALRRSGGNPVGVGTPSRMRLTNGQRFEIRIVEIAAQTSRGLIAVDLAPAEKDISSLRSVNVNLPPGTTQVRIRFQEWDNGNRRFESRSKEESFSVSGESFEANIR